MKKENALLIKPGDFDEINNRRVGYVENCIFLIQVTKVAYPLLVSVQQTISQLNLIQWNRNTSMFNNSIIDRITRLSRYLLPNHQSRLIVEK